MRRSVSVVLLTVLAALLHVGSPPSASAGAPIAGQLVDFTTDNPVSGTTIRLHVDDGGAPGAVVGTDTTDADGRFSVMPTVAGTYWVEVVRTARVQGGYVSDEATGPSWVQYGTSDGATPVAAGTDLGEVLDAPSFISGVVVNAANGNRLRGIRVSTRDVLALGTVLNADTTNSDGFFRIPIWGEDFGLRVNGSARGFENGWRGCAGGVVPTWGAACQSPIGRIGKVRLDRL